MVNSGNIDLIEDNWIYEPRNSTKGALQGCCIGVVDVVAR